jgi:hypothetical protein
MRFNTNYFNYQLCNIIHVGEMSGKLYILVFAGLFTLNQHIILSYCDLLPGHVFPRGLLCHKARAKFLPCSKLLIHECKEPPPNLNASKPNILLLKPPNYLNKLRNTCRLITTDRHAALEASICCLWSPKYLQ